MTLWWGGEGSKSGEGTRLDRVLASADPELYAPGWKGAGPSAKLGLPAQHGMCHDESPACPPHLALLHPQSKALGSLPLQGLIN